MNSNINKKGYRVTTKIFSAWRVFSHSLFPGFHCKYIPSCSHYAEESILEHGIFKGGVLAVWRILRCNPWSKGGYDPIRKIRQKR